MKRRTVILSFVLPRLNDKAAAQFIELLRAILDATEHHYAAQVQRYHQRQREIQYHRQPPASPLPDNPF